MAELDELAERDGIAQIIMGGLSNGVAEYIADALRAAGYRKSREVRTAAELDALPALTIVRDVHGDAWQCYEIDGWEVVGGDPRGQFNLADLLPATVLHEGGAA